MPEPETARETSSAAVGRWAGLLISLALVGLTAFLYAPVRDFGFVSLDDPYYIQQNPYVQGGLTWDNVGWAFTHARMHNWHPLSWMSHMVDVELFGNDAGGHHLTNAVLQALNVVLLFWVLRALTGSLWRSAAVAALFAAHPLRVESVAWVTERKDLLAGTFFLCTLLAWLRYARGPSGTRYVWVALCFLLGLLCKSTVITLPALLLLLDVWPLRRVEGRWFGARTGDSPGMPACPVRSVGVVIAEKLPLLVLSIGSAAMTLWAAGDRGASSATMPTANKLATPAMGYMEYLGKTFWPEDLACFYPLPPGFADGVLDHWILQGALFYGLLVLVTVAVLVLSFGAQQKAYLATGWFWFLGMLVPVIGFMQVGSQLLADRFSYLPQIGLLVAIVWGLADLLNRFRLGLVLGPALVVGVVVSLAMVTVGQVQTWRSSYRLFEHAAAVTEDNYFARQSFGAVLAKRGQREAAQEQLRQALRINPTFIQTHLTLAEVLVSGIEDDGSAEVFTSPDWQEAKQLLALAARIDEGSFEARFNLGKLLKDEGQFEASLTLLRQATILRPSSLECAAILGWLEVEHGDLGAGIESLKGVVERRPEHAPSREMLREARRRRRDG